MVNLNQINDELTKSYFIEKIKDLLLEVDENERLTMLIRTLKYMLNAKAVGFYIPANESETDYLVAEGALDNLLSGLSKLKSSGFDVISPGYSNNGSSYLTVTVDINNEKCYIIAVNENNRRGDKMFFSSEDIEITKKIAGEVKVLINKKAVISREGKSANNPSLSLSPHKSPLLP